MEYGHLPHTIPHLGTQQAMQVAAFANVVNVGGGGGAGAGMASPRSTGATGEYAAAAVEQAAMVGGGRPTLEQAAAMKLQGTLQPPIVARSPVSTIGTTRESSSISSATTSSSASTAKRPRPSAADCMDFVDQPPPSTPSGQGGGQGNAEQTSPVPATPSSPLPTPPSRPASAAPSPALTNHREQPPSPTQRTDDEALPPSLVRRSDEVLAIGVSLKPDLAKDAGGWQGRGRGRGRAATLPAWMTCSDGGEGDGRVPGILAAQPAIVEHIAGPSYNKLSASSAASTESSAVLIVAGGASSAPDTQGGGVEAEKGEAAEGTAERGGGLGGTEGASGASGASEGARLAVAAVLARAEAKKEGREGGEDDDTQPGGGMRGGMAGDEKIMRSTHRSGYDTCHDFLRGNCHRGDSCRFSHESGGDNQAAPREIAAGEYTNMGSVGMDAREVEPARRVFLPRTSGLSDRDLLSFLAGLGTVTHFNTVANNGGGGGVAFAAFATPEEAEAVIREGHFLFQGGVHIRVTMHMHHPSSNMFSAHDAHSEGGVGPGLGTRVSNAPTRGCIDFARGMCNRGDKCRFSHEQNSSGGGGGGGGNNNSVASASLGGDHRWTTSSDNVRWGCNMCQFKNRPRNDICGDIGGAAKGYGCGNPRPRVTKEYAGSGGSSSHGSPRGSPRGNWGGGRMQSCPDYFGKRMLECQVRFLCLYPVLCFCVVCQKSEDV